LVKGLHSLFKQKKKCRSKSGWSKRLERRVADIGFRREVMNSTGKNRAENEITSWEATWYNIIGNRQLEDQLGHKSNGQLNNI